MSKRTTYIFYILKRFIYSEESKILIDKFPGWYLIPIKNRNMSILTAHSFIYLLLGLVAKLETWFF